MKRMLTIPGRLPGASSISQCMSPILLVMGTSRATFSPDDTGGDTARGHRKAGEGGGEGGADIVAMLKLAVNNVSVDCVHIFETFVSPGHTSPSNAYSRAVRKELLRSMKMMVDNVQSWLCCFVLPLLVNTETPPRCS